MIKFFICSDEHAGHAEAMARGWLPIAARRYVEGWEGPQADRHEVRLVRRLSDFEWMPGLTFVRAADFARCPMCRGTGKIGRKVPRETGHSALCPECHGSGADPEAAKFEALVATGQARWDSEPDPRIKSGGELIHGNEEVV